MTQQKKKKTMSREEALSLYQDMQRTMSKVLKNSSEYERELKSKGMNTGGSNASMSSLQSALMQSTRIKPRFSGNQAAVAMLLFCAAAKICLAALDFSGVTTLPVAHATTAATAQVSSEPFTKEEIQVLTSLDARRAELEDRSNKLQLKEQDLQKRDQEFAMRLTELRDLSSKLKLERDKDGKKKTQQLDQLANVYIAMNPQDAAQLLQQLDESIALALLERMPEKRMGQILPLMSPDRALRVTKMLSK